MATILAHIKIKPGMETRMEEMAKAPHPGWVAACHHGEHARS